MKKLLFFLSAALIIAACNDKTAGTGTSDQAQKNLDAFRIVSKAFQTGDISGIDSVVSPDFIDHTERGDMGRDSLKAMIKMMAAYDSTMKLEVVKELADDEYVMGWMRYSGTSDGSWMPAGPYTMNGVEVVKFKDGLIVEHWGFMEATEVAKMRNMSPMPSTNTPDSAK